MHVFVYGFTGKLKNKILFSFQLHEKIKYLKLFPCFFYLININRLRRYMKNKSRKCQPFSNAVKMIVRKDVWKWQI